MTTDSNGNRIFRSVRKEGDVWGANVWWGSGCVTSVRRYYYASRTSARNADISDEIGKSGRVQCDDIAAAKLNKDGTFKH